MMMRTAESHASDKIRQMGPIPWMWPRVLASILLTLAALGFLACSYVDAWHTPWLEQRIVPTIALAHGLSIYHMPGSGPLIGTTYAPLSYLVFLPIAVFSHVLPVFAAGSLLSTFLMLLPLALALGFQVKGNRLSRSDAWLLFVFGFVALVFLRPFNYVVSMVDSDAPAICFMTLSLLILYWKLEAPSRAMPAWSSLLLVLSIGCKQNMLVAGIVVLLTTVYFFGRAVAVRYVAWTILWGVCALGTVAAIYGNLRVVYFNNVTVPTHIHVEKGSLVFGTYDTYQYGAALVLFLVGVCLIWFLSAAEARPRSGRFLLAFFAVAAVMVPVSIRTYAIVGGDANAFSHALYFLLVGSILTAAELIAALGRQPRPVAALRCWTIAAAFLLLASGAPMRFDRARIQLMRETPAALAAYRYDLQHPGEVYFPSNSVATYLAEGRLYETDWGVLNLTVAGQALNRQDVLRYLPPDAKYLAVPRGIVQPEYLYPFFSPHRIPAKVPGLENFWVYLLER